MGIRRKKITGRRREKIDELLTSRSPQEVYEVLRPTRDRVGLSTIYKIRRKSQQESAVGGVVVEQIKAAEHEQELTEETSHAQQANGKEKLVALIQKWQEQLQFPSVAQLLRESYFQNLLSGLAHEIAEPEEFRQTYFRAQKRNLGTITKPFRVTLPVESEALFEDLKKLHPDAELWQAQQSWDKAHGVYLDAFVAWAPEVDLSTELLIGLWMDENVNGAVNSKVASAHQLVKEAKRTKPVVWLLHRLLTLTIACDVFLLAIEQLSPQAIQPLEMEEIRQLRLDVVLRSMSVLPKGFWLTDTNRVHAFAKSLWDTPQPPRDETITLVKALDTLQTAQNNVCDKLKALELMFT